MWDDFKEISLSAITRDEEGRIKKEDRVTLIPKLRNQVKPYLDKYRETILNSRTGTN